MAAHLIEKTPLQHEIIVAGVPELAAGPTDGKDIAKWAERRDVLNDL